MMRHVRISLSVSIVLVCTAIAFATVAHAALTVTVPSLPDLLSGNSSANRAAMCLGSAYDFLKNGLGDKLSQIDNIAGGMITQALGGLVSCAVKAMASKAIGKIPGIGGVVGGLLGGASGPDCVQTVKSDTMGYLKAQWQQTKQESFLAQCSVAFSITDIGDTVDRMIQEQGPGGVAAYAQNWGVAAYIEPDELARRRFWSELVNTKICGQFKDYALDYFGVPQSYRDNPPDISSIELRVNADSPFMLSAACTLPDDYQPPSDAAAFILGGGWSLMAQLAEPQNNRELFLRLGEEELAHQRSAMLESANTQLIAGGGYLPTYGNAGENCLRAPDSNGCIDYGTIKQAPGAVRDMRTATLQAEMNFILNAANSDGTDAGVSDMATRIQARLLDMASEPLPFQISLGLTDNPNNYTPTPTPSLPPGSGNADDPLCTGGNLQCVCIQNDTGAQALGNTLVKNAIAKAMTMNPSLFIPGTEQIVPGTDARLVLQAICDQVTDVTCQPHPSKTNEIVLITGGTGLGFDVITSDGFIRMSGGIPVAACEYGVQN